MYSLPLWLYYLLNNKSANYQKKRDFPVGSDGKESAWNTGDLGPISGPEDPLEKEMTTHSSIHAWRIPWTEESGGLQSTRSRRVGHTSKPKLNLKKKLLICLWFHWAFVAVHGASLVLLSRDYSSCSAQGSHCCGFSCCRVRVLGHTGFRSCCPWAKDLQLLGSRAWPQ